MINSQQSSQHQTDRIFPINDSTIQSDLPSFTTLIDDRSGPLKWFHKNSTEIRSS